MMQMLYLRLRRKRKPLNELKMRQLLYKRLKKRKKPL